MLIVDRREPGADGLVTLLAAHHIEAAVDTLAYGDFFWFADCPVLVERKAVADLRSSAGDGRLVRFAQDVPPTWWRVVLVEGDHLLPPAYGNWTAEQQDDLLLSLQFGGIMVAHCRTGALVPRLAALYHWTQREHLSLRRPVVVEPEGDYGLQPGRAKAAREAVRFLMGLPGVGEDRARDLLVVHKEPGQAFDHLRAGTVVVKGIGQGTVDKVRQFLGKAVDIS